MDIKNKTYTHFITNDELRLNLKVNLILEPLILRLRRGFGTSHSFSQTRNNALFKIQVQDLSGNFGENFQQKIEEKNEKINEQKNEQKAEKKTEEQAKKQVFFEGLGEVGLPPKKPGCYLSDFSDCQQFLENVDQFLGEFLEQLKIYQKENSNSVCREKEQVLLDFEKYDVFQELDEKYFQVLRGNLNEDVQFFSKVLFFAVEQVTKKSKSFLAPKSGIEAAIFATICDIWQIHFQQLANLSRKVNKSYYTAALQDKYEDIEESANFGIKYTNCLKLKFNEDIQFCVQEVLNKMIQGGIGEKFTIDANAAWSPELGVEFVKEIVKIDKEKKVKIIEQPFGLDFCPGKDKEMDEKWVHFRNFCHQNDILVYGDESVATPDDVDQLLDFVDGFNFKLEKAGGIREALKGIQKARKYGKKVWIGIMVTSDLGTSQSAQILGEGDEGDLDGGLLVFEDKFKGGFEWGKGGEIQIQYQKIGFAVEMVENQK